MAGVAAAAALVPGQVTCLSGQPAHPPDALADGSVSGTLKLHKSTQPELGPDVQVRPLRCHLDPTGLAVHGVARGCS